MNILLINHYAGSKMHGMEYRPYYFAREWVRLGHQVTIVAASFSHLRTTNPAVNGRVTEQWIEGIRYLWYRTRAYRGNGAGRVANIVSFVGKLLRDRRWLVRTCRPDLVIASSTYPLDSLPAHRIARAASAQLVHEVHDLWPLTPIELGGMSPRHPFIMLMQWAENFAYRKADRVVSMLPKALGHMCEHGMAPEKFVYVPNGVAVEEWTNPVDPLPEPHCQAVDRVRREGRFVVGYVGGHALSNALGTLIEAAPALERENVGILLVGQGVEKVRLQQRAGELRLRHTIFLPPIAKRLVPSLLAELDTCYLGWTRSPLYRYGICPNKLLDYMMAAKPVVHAIEAGNDPVAEAGCGLSISPEDVDALVGAVGRLRDLPAVERLSMGQRGKDYIVARHDYRVLAEQFLAAVGEKAAPPAVERT
jgi:glycosyltransferase involved in cell wall biosynthesis